MGWFGCGSRGTWALTLVAAVVLVTPLKLHAQAGRVFSIGYMMPPTQEGSKQVTENLLKGLGERGYAEGRNIRIHYRYADNDLSRLPALAKELVALKPDVIVTATPPGIRAAMAATKEIPIVMAAVYDPVGLGLVKSLRQPGGNVTGMSVQYEDTIPKLLELITAVVPALRKIAILQTVDPSHDRFVARITKLGESRQIGIEAFEARTPPDIAPAFEKIGASRSDALFVLPHPLFNARPKEIVELVHARNLPAIYPFTRFALAGGLMSFGVDVGDSFRRSAYFVDRILRGARPADLPVEQPTKIDLVVNLKTAKRFGLSVPSTVLLRADQVIE